MTKRSMRVPALLLSLTVFLGGCDALDRLLSVEAPSRVEARDRKSVV